MNAGRLRTGWLCGLAAATLAAPVVHAQDTPTPSPSAAPIITPTPRAPQQLQGVIPERFSIAPAATPTPAPVPTSTPTPSPTPSAAAPATQRQAPVARATSSPREAAPVAVVPTPQASPTSAPLATPTPLASAAPQPVATAAPRAEPQDATPPWIWVAAGAGGTALLGIGAWLLLRRRRDDDEEEAVAPEPVAAPPPPLRVQPPPGLAPPSKPEPAPVQVAQPGEPFELVLNPRRVVYGEQEVLLEFELLVGNASGASAENIRVAFAAMSAHAQQDAVIAGFHGGPPGEPGGAPFDLAPGAGARMPVRLAIPHSGIQVVQLGGRPMFVPIVLIDLRWRGGLSVRRFGADFMLGTAGQGDKLGPLWLDRPAPTGPLGAHRYFAKAAVAA
ncbi:hypothetical protein P6144_09705 [Sphingomonas sp. HITSZ_GF]|uniref:hypothetical protein n=1 Tax=Sphingomonas sp. HITSZ_GF TaxID=3037247 RepID=UPI00240D4379|nr:hypothetical protein [Sphingomonas sp. HITSZ_GF]MDG2533920.1 hypothetical protein [Sphingomonas sp. HITSZ_GF]